MGGCSALPADPLLEELLVILVAETATDLSTFLRCLICLEK